jgi:hypothetical protein
MIGLGFFEIVIIALVGLLIVGVVTAIVLAALASGGRGRH